MSIAINTNVVLFNSCYSSFMYNSHSETEMRNFSVAMQQC